MQGKEPRARQKRGVKHQATSSWGRCQRWACSSTKLWLKALLCRGWRLVLSVPPLCPQLSQEGPAPAAVASTTLQRCRTRQSRLRSLSLGAEHPSVYPTGAVVSRLLMALMRQGAGVCSCCACCTRLPAPRWRASQSPSPLRRVRRLAAALQTSGSFWIRGLQLFSLPCLALARKLNGNAAAGCLACNEVPRGVRPHCNNDARRLRTETSPGEVLAGRKQVAEAAGRRKGMHCSSSPVRMLRCTVGVGVLALPTQLPSHQSHITWSCHGTEP